MTREQWMQCYGRWVSKAAPILAAFLMSMMPAGAQLVPAANRIDMAFDDLRGILYIGNGGEVVRYRLSDQTLLAPIPLGGLLAGMDVSPDGNTLAIADAVAVGTENFVHLLDLETGAVNPVAFTLDSGESGTYSVAWGSDGGLLVTSRYSGSGWVPMRHYDPSSGTVTILPDVRTSSMLTASADRSVIGYEESDISSGPVGRYRVSDGNILEGAGTSWFNYEVGVNRNGTQYAVPTYGGCFIYDGALQPVTTIGTYAGAHPIGVVYHPTDDLVFFAWADTSEVRAHDTSTFGVVGTYDTGTGFDSPGNSAYREGRLKIARDGSKLFCTVDGGVLIIHLTNSAPFARDDVDAGVTDADQELVGTVNLLANDSDIDVGNTLTVSAFDVNSVAGASVTVSSDGNFHYDPTVSLILRALAVGDSMVDTFTYTVSDGALTSTATVSITVNGTDPLENPAAVPALGNAALLLLASAMALTGLGRLRHGGQRGRVS